MDMSIDAWSNLLFNIYDLGAHQVPLLAVAMENDRNMDRDGLTF